MYTVISSMRYVLGTLGGNRDLRRVQAAFVAHNCGEYASWVAMLVYAYAQGGVTESGIVATVMLIPAAVFAPVMSSLGQHSALGTTLFAAYVAQAVTSGLVAVALLSDAPKLVVYALLVGPSVAFHDDAPDAVCVHPEPGADTGGADGHQRRVRLDREREHLRRPALTGVVLAVGSEAVVFALVGVACLGGALLVFPLRGRGGVVRDERDEDSGASLSSVIRDPQARMLILLLGAECIAIGALDVLVVELALGGLDLGADWAGYLTAAFGAGGILAVGLTARLVGLARLAPSLVVSLAVWSIAFMGLAAVTRRARGARAPGRGGRIATISTSRAERCCRGWPAPTSSRAPSVSSKASRWLRWQSDPSWHRCSIWIGDCPSRSASSRRCSRCSLSQLVGAARHRSPRDGSGRPDRAAALSLPLFRRSFPPPTLESLARALPARCGTCRLRRHPRGRGGRPLLRDRQR